MEAERAELEAEIKSLSTADNIAKAMDRRDGQTGRSKLTTRTTAGAVPSNPRLKVGA